MLRGGVAASLRRRPFPSRSPSACASGYHASALPGQAIADPDGPKMKQAKVKKKEKKSAGGKKGGGRDEQINLLARALDVKPDGPPPPSEEELARRAEIVKAYTKGNFEFHNDINHDLANKIKLKNHAIKMLPREHNWKKEAVKISMAKGDIGPPYGRHIPTDYPPVKDFDETVFLQTKEED